MRIEGAGIADHLKITYTHLVDADWGKEFWFVVSMMSRDYEGIYIYPCALLGVFAAWDSPTNCCPSVTKCRPKLDPEEVARVVDKLNESREFSPFLKDMRQLFKKAAVGE